MKLPVLAGLALAAMAPFSSAQVNVYTVSPQSDLIRRIDLSTGATLSSVPITLAGETVTQGLALAVHPITHQIYALLSLQSTSNMIVVTVNPSTGVATLVGDPGDRFSSITFASDGTLYGVVGDGGSVPETLYMLDPNTAAATLLFPLGHGSNGESIVFDPATGTLLHASGAGMLNDLMFGLALETVDVSSGATSQIMISGPSFQQIMGLARLDSATWLFGDLNGKLCHLSHTGVVSIVGQLDHIPKGFAFQPGPGFFAPYGSGCPGTGGFVPTLSGTGSPSAGDTVTLTIGSALGGATGVLFFGVGTGSANLVPACALQVMPILPTMITLPMLGVGAGAGGIALPGQIPGNISTFDVYLQVAIGDNGAAGHIAATNPLRMHLQ